jgi:hypothetical protein
MKILELKLSRCLISLIGVVAVTSLFTQAFDFSGVGWAQTTIIEAKFDTPGAIEVISADSFSVPLPAGSAPAVDAQIQAFLQSGGFQFTPLGWSLSGETRGCDDGIIFGNLYLTTDPILTAAFGANSIIFIPVGLRCGTGVGDIPFGEGEAILIVTIGPQVPTGYFAPVEVLMWSGADTAIEAGVNGMLLRLDFVQ